MLKATLRFIRDSERSSQDDIIHFYVDDIYHEMVRVTFRPADVTKYSEFYLDERRAVGYVSTVLKSMQHDTDPFEFIQVDTAMHPTILYHVADMDKREIRWSIEDTIADAIHQAIHKKS